MSGVNDRPSKPPVVTPRPGAISPHRVLLAVLMVAIFISAVVGVAVTLSMGQTQIAIIISIVAGGFFLSALC